MAKEIEHKKIDNKSVLKANREFDEGFEDAVAGRPQKGSSKNYFAGYQKGFEMAEAVGLNRKRSR